MTRFRRAAPERIVRSRRPAHPEIISVETFTVAQLLRRSKASGGLATARKAERGGRSTGRPYPLRGVLRCGICQRKMQGAAIRRGTYYRCTARSMAPGSAALACHLRTVNLREEVVLEPLNGWIGRLFDRTNIDDTVTSLVSSQGGGAEPGMRRAVRAFLADAQARLRRHQAAIEAGVDPAALVDAMNAAQAERAAAQAELDAAPVTGELAATDVYAMVDLLGDVGAMIADARPERLNRLYRELGLELRYKPGEQPVYATARPNTGNLGAVMILPIHLVVGWCSSSRRGSHAV